MLQTHNPCPHHLSLNFSEGFFDDSHGIMHDVGVGDPKPVNKPLKGYDKDLVVEYHKEISTYYEKFASVSKDLKSGSNCRLLTQDFQDTNMTITRNMLKFYQQYGICRIEPFLSDYNPFYASGLLESFEINQQTYLITPDSDNNLRLTNVMKKKSKLPKLLVKEPFDTSILGLCASYSKSGDILLLVRLKFSVKLLEFGDLKSVAPTVWCKTFTLPILSADLSPKYVSVITSDLKLSMINFNTNQALDVGDFDCLDSNLKSNFFDTNLVGIMNEKSLKLVDLRTPNNYKSFEPNLDRCDHFCTFKIDNDTIYVGSRHHVLRSDIRLLKNHQFCSHLMKHSPSFMDALGTNLILANQSGEKVFFQGSNTLPRKIPTINDVYRKCQLYKDCLLKDDLISKRLQLSTVGVKLLQGSSLYSANCVGDIFKQEINVGTTPDHSSSIDNLHKFIELLPQCRRDLYITDLVNVSDLRFTLTKSFSNDKTSDGNTTGGEFLRRFQSRYSRYNLTNVAENFAEIWGCDDEVCDLDKDIELVPEVQPHEKVTDWIGSNFFN